jgi:site-specific DNA-adenine methylase
VKAPFVWFGGKRRVASEVWDALGDVDNYVEPFAGSLAVLLERPHDLNDGTRRAETVNDADHMLANFWRALAADPEAVARFADWPVNEDDLFARHLWLVNQGRTTLVAGLESDPEFYDPKIAGWWVWGLSAWIGGGWCSGAGPWVYSDEGRPHLGTAGQGVHRQLPHLGDAGQGVHRQLPHLGDAGQGVHQPDTQDAWTAGGSGAPANRWNRTTGRRALYDYFDMLAARLRDVRVCTGNWSRVVTRGALSYGSTVGVFLDPPYLGELRAKGLYAHDDHDVSHEVREWCITNGEDPRLRIVLAGYVDEHDHLMPDGWRRHRYSATRAYGRSSGGSRNAENRHKECLWFSPHTLKPAQDTLWGVA